MTIPHDLHRRRRKPLEPFFSKQGVGELEPMLSSLTRRFCERIDGYKGTPKVIQLSHALPAYTGDVITRICCDEYPHLVEDENFSPSWSATLSLHNRRILTWYKARHPQEHNPHCPYYYKFSTVVDVGCSNIFSDRAEDIKRC